MAQASSQTLSRRSSRHARWQTLLGLLVIAGFLYLVVPHLGTFRESLTVIKHVRLAWLLASLAAASLTYVVAAASYQVLAKRQLSFSRTVLAQIAGAFVNRILPGGIGTLSINFDYLRKNKHTVAEASSVIAVNNGLSIIGNVALILAVLPFLPPVRLEAFALPRSHVWVYWAVGGAVIIALALVLWSRKLRSGLYRALWGMQRNIVKYRAHPLRLLAAFLLSVALTLLYALCLLACAEALGTAMTIAQALIITSVGVVAATATPTPGGLVGAEAGLFAGCVAFDLPSAKALAIVLAYRFFTYWLQLPIGAVVLVVAEHADYL